MSWSARGPRRIPTGHRVLDRVKAVRRAVPFFLCCSETAEQDTNCELLVENFLMSSDKRRRFPARARQPKRPQPILTSDVHWQ